MCSDRARFQYHLFFTSKIRQINIQIRPFDSWVNVKFVIDAFEFGHDAFEFVNDQIDEKMIGQLVSGKASKFVEKSVNSDVHGRNYCVVSSVTGVVIGGRKNVAVLAQVLVYPPAEQETFGFHSRTCR